MAHSVEDYRGMLQRLLPRGILWECEPGTKLRGLLHGCAAELARVESDAERLLREIDPLNAIEALEDWERELGLPDECGEVGRDIGAKREAVRRKLQRGTYMNAAFYKELAKSAGFAEVDIFSASPFRVEKSRVGDVLFDEGVSNVFWVGVNSAGGYRRFLAGSSAGGQNLSYAAEPVLECVITREKPAHTAAVFQYYQAGGV